MNNANNTEHQEEKKTAVIKALAIVGFVAALIIGVWLAVQIVRFIPDAFSSLASLLDGTNTGEETDLTIAANEHIVNVGEPVTISWTMLRADGEYVFSYACVDGTAAEMRTADGDLTPIACGSEIVLPAERNNVEVVFYSEKQRFVDIAYTVAFLGDNEEDSRERENVITVVNPDISANGVSVDDTPDENDEDTTDNEDDTPTPSPSQPTGYITVPKVVTEFPASDPNGHADLQVRFIGVGEYDTGKDRFRARTSLEEGADGAIQFEVRNVGTKTSGSWYFSAELPTDPEFTYSSRSQSGLRPNEFEIITLRFDNVTDEGSETTRIRVSGGNDANSNNNTVTPRIRIED